MLYDISVICVLDPWISRQKATSGVRAIIDTALEAWPKHTWLQDSHILGILCLHEGRVFSWLNGCNLTLTTHLNLDLLARPVERLWLGSVTDRTIVIFAVRVMFCVLRVVYDDDFCLLFIIATIALTARFRLWVWFFLFLLMEEFVDDLCILDEEYWLAHLFPAIPPLGLSVSRDDRLTERVEVPLLLVWHQTSVRVNLGVLIDS